MHVAVACLAAFLALAAAGIAPPDMSWEDDYKPWRQRDTVPLHAWVAAIPTPKPVMPTQDWDALSLPQRQQHFSHCITNEAKELSQRVLEYRAPKLTEVQETVRSLLKSRGLKVSVSVFWGRGRYVKILWPYLERNLVANLGVVGEVLLITHNRDAVDGKTEARTILEHAVSTYPGVVKEVPFCPLPYGCAFDQILNATDRVYIKLDDDIIFIKDGSFEHLALQVLTNKDYTLFSGSVVNNPHGYAVHQFVGAFPPVTFHFRDTHQLNAPPLLNISRAEKLYWGKNVYDAPGAVAHESFIYNVAHGRLDAYGFDIWNMNECKCAEPQPAMDYCSEGYYRWSINAIAWSYNVSRQEKRKVPAFDEPFVSLGWPKNIAPHRVGMVGEALFVHCQYTRQRTATPDFGLREDVMLPWYTILMRQYTAKAFGGWKANATLFSEYESMAIAAGERRFQK